MGRKQQEASRCAQLLVVFSLWHDRWKGLTLFEHYSVSGAFFYHPTKSSGAWSLPHQPSSQCESLCPTQGHLAMSSHSQPPAQSLNSQEFLNGRCMWPATSLTWMFLRPTESDRLEWRSGIFTFHKHSLVILIFYRYSEKFSEKLMYLSMIVFY